ncbi:pyridoxamine 5'-phosphate oxidase family protein [Sphingomonas limnosediminicola]|uniref:Pyridoxamine 5'-phosphate oxidase family protein n=1 Tax=Sphingomonas limnosediminicola TaxID=940133 RepID=A0ABP7L0S3_9SPHN
MADLQLSDISEKMRDIDFAILSTRTSNGDIAARPMSNNRQVEYDGDNFFFTNQDTGSVRDITGDPSVGLAYQAKSGALHMKPFFITVEGKAELIRDKARFEKHWTKDLDDWFKEGFDTPGLVLIKVHASRIHYWDGYREGEIDLAGGVQIERSVEIA